MNTSQDLPMVCIQAQTLPEGWERAVCACWYQGVNIATQYDHPGDPPSKEVSLCLSVAEPFAEPRIHRAMPGGIYDLEVYRQEVVDGIHDHWIDPEAGKWSYTYHERFTNYKLPGVEVGWDQLSKAVLQLSNDPNTRQAQAITWQPWCDPFDTHSPCLQRLWFRLIGDRLVMNVHIRSNDAYKAAFMNMWAFTELQAQMARDISDNTGRTIEAGQYNHFADSFHIYGSYFKEFEGFLASLEARTFEQRTYTSEQVDELFTEAKEKIANEQR